MGGKKKNQNEATIEAPEAIEGSDIIEELYGSLGHIVDPSPTTVKAVKATRNFDQLTRNQVLVVDTNETYWSQNLASGNLVEVVE